MKKSSFSASAIVLALLGACTSSTSAPPDSSVGGDAAGDSNITLPDTSVSMDTGRPDGTSTAEAGADTRADTNRPDTSTPDSGPRPDVMLPMDDAGSTPADLAASSAASNRAVIQAICDCTHTDRGYQTAADCAAIFAGPPEMATCIAAGMTAEPAASAYFSCSSQVDRQTATCYGTAACNETALDTCQSNGELLGGECPTLSDAEFETFQTAVSECVVTTIVGAAGACPDTGAASSAVGASVFTGNTVGAGNDIELTVEGTTCSSETTPAVGSPDRVHSWTAPSTGRFRIDTNGSSYDTFIGVLTNCTTPIVCNDDYGSRTDPPSHPLRSAVEFEATAGTTYLIAVDGYYNADDDEPSAGAYIVNINPVTAGDAGVPDGGPAADGGSPADGGSASDAGTPAEGGTPAVDGGSPPS